MEQEVVLTMDELKKMFHSTDHSSTATLIKPKPKVEVESNSDVCKVCKGTGWELYMPDRQVFDEMRFPDDYQPQEYARKCTACNGMSKAQYDRTKVPDMYYEADIYKFDFDCYGQNLQTYKKIAMNMFNNFKEWQKADRGLYLWSKTPGSGKTYLACCLGKSIMMKHNVVMKFITAPDYMQVVAESYERERGAANPTDEYKNADVLILDDIGAQMDSKRGWERSELFKLVNDRIGCGKVTIYTSNMPIDDLNLDERTKSRIGAVSLEMHMPEVSIRKQNREAKQNEFIKGLLSDGQ